VDLRLTAQLLLRFVSEQSISSHQALAGKSIIVYHYLISNHYFRGGFMLIRSSNGSYETIDFRESAPAAASIHMFDHDSRASLVGGLAVAVPGEIAGFKLAHSRHGLLPFEDLFAPSIKLARNGWIVSSKLALTIKVYYY
jgi:Gamma-glutamyltranspeptidase